ncbi:peptide chain release factor 1 [Lawsonella clevelandensis]|uniref:Peptide chain release factor 1 n=1 Tax=Lawsonella clevelandensis TaxID=1528099 RepID=A0A0M3TBG7_9ACTN|nr:peptide chain release factor 1 [Lawsonella clevelandensis]ALE18614.1 peptide chain release factor 1 [Lawsonella clevelandensis]MDU7193497.1 peptide chain release factor 1 [Lawsonella clevelandensis]
MATAVSAVDDVLSEYAGLEAQLADPELHNDQAAARRVAKRFAELGPVVKCYRELQQAQDDLEAARELADEDASFKEEAVRLELVVASLEEQLTDLLAPRDPHDGDDIVLEVKSGEGGEESALFAADLARMYTKYFDKLGWRVEVLDATESDMGGYKDISMSVKTREPSRDGVWSKMKFEGGVHRVQRVPVTESQGRIHTSAAGVFVFPEPEEVEEIEIDEKDIRIDVYRSSGKGGQGVNTTDSAVRITYLPTGLIVTCQNERSQLQNKIRAMQVLKARLQAIREEEAAAESASGRTDQVRTVDRSERIRTYNFPENRITDHRIGYKAHNLDQVLDGDMGELIDALVEADRKARIEAE